MTSIPLRAMLSAERRENMKTFIAASALAAAFGLSSPATAQYPAKPIRILQPLPAGATADTVTRIVAQPLSQVLGQPVLVDNKPGADGAIASELAARSAPDGYTLLSGGNTNMLGVPTLRKNPPYDPVADFAPITSVFKFTFFLVVHPSVPAKTLRELIDHARANMMFGTGGITAPLVKEGKLRALATLLPVRSPMLPDVPTIAEAGMPQLSVVIWGGLFGPAKMPKEIVDRLSREVNAILQRPAVREQFEKLGVEASGSTPEELAAFLKQQLVDWGKAAREAGLKPE